MDNSAIIFENVTKTYKLYKSDKARFLGIFTKKIKYKENKAINNMSFNILKGEGVAFLGKNGAGKSTIMKMITGVSFPISEERRVGKECAI